MPEHQIALDTDDDEEDDRIITMLPVFDSENEAKAAAEDFESERGVSRMVWSRVDSYKSQGYSVSPRVIRNLSSPVIQQMWLVHSFHGRRMLVRRTRNELVRVD